MWDRLRHAYGTADDLPRTLGALRSLDPAVRADARWWLRACVVHQGTRYEASAPVASELAVAVGDPELPDRPEVLGLLADLAVGDADAWLETGADPDHATPEAVAVQRALAAGFRSVADLLDDPDPAVRAGALRVSSVVTAAAGPTRDLAVARATDPAPAVRAAAAVAAAVADRSLGEQRAVGVLRASLADPDLRVAAVAGAFLGPEGVEACARLVASSEPTILEGLGWFGGDTAPLAVEGLSRVASRDPRARDVLLAALAHSPLATARRALRPALAAVTDRVPPSRGWTRSDLPDPLRTFVTVVADRPELGEPEVWSALSEQSLPRSPAALRAWLGRRDPPGPLATELGKLAVGAVAQGRGAGEGGPTVVRRFGEGTASFVIRGAVQSYSKRSWNALAKLLSGHGADAVPVLVALAEEQEATLTALTPAMDKVAAGAPDAVLAACEALAEARGGRPRVVWDERGTVEAHHALVVLLGLGCRAARAAGRLPAPSLDGCAHAAATDEAFGAELARWIELVPEERVVALSERPWLARGVALDALVRKLGDGALAPLSRRLDPTALLAALPPQRATRLADALLSALEAHLEERERWMRERLVADLRPLADLLATRHPALRSRFLASPSASDRLRAVLGAPVPAPAAAPVTPPVATSRQRELDPNRELSHAVVDLLLVEPLFGYLLGRIDRVWTEDTPSLALAISQRGRISLLLNPRYFVSTLGHRRVRVGALRHEVLHLLLEHPFRDDLRNVDLGLYGTAADVVLNELPGARWPLPSDARRRTRLPVEAPTDATVRVLYDLLLSHKIRTGAAPSTEIWHSDHRFWRQERGGRPVSHEDLLEASGRVDSWVETGFRVLGAEATHGLDPGTLEAALNALERRRASLDWRKVLRMFAASSRRTVVTHTLKRPSRRYGTLPGLRVRRHHRLAVAVDTSGSIRDEDLASFFSEIEGIWRAGSEIVVVECDAKVHAAWPYAGRRPSAVGGRGGTAFEPVMQWLHRPDQGRFDALVYLTDGQAEAPSTRPPCPVLWVVTLTGWVGEHLRFGRSVRLSV